MKKAALLGVLAGAVILSSVALWSTRTLALTGSLHDAVAQRSLRKGDRNEAVTALQRQLKIAGFDPGPPDGVYGPRTESAVRKLQEARGITVDGIAGKQTIAAVLRTAEEPAAPAAMKPAAPAQAASPQPAPPQPAAEPKPMIVQAPVAIDFSKEWTNLNFHTAGADDSHRPARSGPAGSPVTETQGPQTFALTFNGKPDPALLPELLGTLDRCQAKATFFISGQAAAETPRLIADIAAQGHEIANAGYNSTDMTSLNDALVSANLRLSQRAIEAASGKTPTHFRPPLGLFDDRIAQVAERQHLKLALWTSVGVSDVTEIAPETLAQRITRSVYPGAVIMLHQDRVGTVRSLDGILQTLRQQGHASVTLTDLEAPQTDTRTTKSER